MEKPDRKHDQDRRYPEPATGSPALKPVQLKREQPRAVKPAQVTARPTSLRGLQDTSAPAKPVSEHKQEMLNVSERRPDAVPGQEHRFPLRSISVTPVQMQDLRERRIAARDLGWMIPGGRILMDRSG